MEGVHRNLGPDWATVFTPRTGTTRPIFLGFLGPNPFGTKHDGLGPGWPDLISSTKHDHDGSPLV
jgi:hypothetical protein